MSTKVKIDIDLSAWMDIDGVHTTVYFGDSCEPTHEVVQDYRELIDQHLISYTVYDKIAEYHREEVEMFITILEGLAAYARNKAMELMEGEND